MPRRAKPVRAEPPQPIVPDHPPVEPYKNAPVSFGNWKNLLLLWIAFCLVLAAFPNHSWMFPAFMSRIPHSPLLLLGLFIGMVVMIKRFPPEPTESTDFSARTTRLFLMFILQKTGLSELDFRYLRNKI